MRNSVITPLLGVFLLVGLARVPAHYAEGAAPEVEPVEAGQTVAPQSSLPVFLLMLCQEPVQRDLRLSPPQIEAVASLMAKFTASAREAIAEAKETNGGAIPSLPKLLAEQSSDVETQIKAIVSDSQLTRLKQLHLRAARAWGLFDPAVQRRLGLSQETVVEARRILRESESECSRVVQKVKAGHVKREDAMTRVDALRHKAHEDVISLLSPTQHLKMEDLLGPIPDFDPSKLCLRLILTPQASPPKHAQAFDGGGCHSASSL